MDIGQCYHSGNMAQHGWRVCSCYLGHPDISLYLHGRQIYLQATQGREDQFLPHQLLAPFLPFRCFRIIS